MQLQRPMASATVPNWDGAKWVGELDVAHVTFDTTTPVTLTDAEGYTNASLLIRDQGRLRGFVELQVTNGTIDATQLLTKVAVLPHVAPSVTDLSLFPHVTVVICTHERAGLLREALQSIANLDYPNYDVLVVDNAPKTIETAYLMHHEFPEVRYVKQFIKGVSYARNRGLKLATGDIIAFTDDDVVADPLWLRQLVTGFAEDENIACVSGLVPSGELLTPSQAYFDDRVTWGKIREREYYSLRQPPKDVPAFPFAVGRYGTGANFAVRKSALKRIGWFDTGFGAGAITGGGEDIDFFTRILFAGYTLMVQPDAIVWHRHRADEAALMVQARGYGIGLGAWLTKLALDPRMWLPLGKRLVSGVKQMRHLGAVTNTATANVDMGIPPQLQQRLTRLEKFSVLQGPERYLRQRLYNLGVTLNPAGLLAVMQENRLVTLGMLTALLQIVVLMPTTMPNAVRALVLLGGMLLLPGSVLSPNHLPRYLRAVLITAGSITVYLLATTLMARQHLWAPEVLLVGIAGGSFLYGAVRLIRARRRAMR